MMLRILLVVGVIAGALGALYAYNGAITDAEVARQEAAKQKRNADEYRHAYDSLIDERELWDELLSDAYRANRRVEQRRQDADARYQDALQELAEARAWAATYAPDRIADSLCLRPGSCVRGNAAADSGAHAGAGTGTAAGTGEGWRLTNDALRDGVEACRAALGRCNTKIDVIAKWNESKKPMRRKVSQAEASE